MSNDNTTTELPIVKILGIVESRQQTTKSGVRTVYFQQAQAECEQLRMRFEHEVDSPQTGLPVGSVHVWDVVSDIQPGQYGSFDLARRKTLRPMQATKPSAAPAKA